MPNGMILFLTIFGSTKQKKLITSEVTPVITDS